MSSGSNGSNIYQYPNMGGAAHGAIGGAGQLATNAGNLGSLASSGISGLSSLTGGTNYGAQQGVNTGNAITGSASPFLAQADQQLSNGGMGSDPAAYNSQFQQNTDQTRAAEAAQGVAGTPYGAGVESQADTNFNNTWYNNQVQRATALEGSGVGASAQGAQTAQGAADNPLGALQSLITSGNMSSAQLQSAITDYLGYLQGGTQAASAQSTAANQQAQAQGTGLAGLGKLAGSIFSAPVAGGGSLGGAMGSGIMSGLGSLAMFL